MEKEKMELLSKEELERMNGGFGVEEVSLYGINLQGVSNCCNTTTTGGSTGGNSGHTSTTTTTTTPPPVTTTDAKLFG